LIGGGAHRWHRIILYMAGVVTSVARFGGVLVAESLIMPISMFSDKIKHTKKYKFYNDWHF
jgi:hypothetical protein